MVQLICTDLSAGHPGRPVLQGLDLQVFAGDFLCVTGENGRGKTTLAKTLLGLLPPLGEQPLPDDQLGLLPQGGLCLAGGAVHPADLGGVHLQHGAGL